MLLRTPIHESPVHFGAFGSSQASVDLHYRTEGVHIEPPLLCWEPTSTQLGLVLSWTWIRVHSKVLEHLWITESRVQESSHPMHFCIYLQNATEEVEMSKQNCLKCISSVSSTSVPTSVQADNSAPMGSGYKTPRKQTPNEAEAQKAPTFCKQKPSQMSVDVRLRTARRNQCRNEEEIELASQRPTGLLCFQVVLTSLGWGG